ncbi:Wadjet anti-phage system protein JetA family protein [Aestuariirhabdus litorea]|uniref:Flagellar protein FliT n=1 Tax=Aestuariirhabdus litorea TaxID=2528527 RepID=A0A3P3VL04_9GAMM|nr:Wadjet anti-phage system protein JetA family protein [Aestuariirhabdus litorea]RRJ82997.1 flagellar protein FliT [Aestuariirhabdus litorea]RWW93156.1 flagellar protein FliT [Endozoicomonadaceae bacterium GTF-13]
MSQSLFFDAQHRHFFKPLTGKYREGVVQCVRALYSHVYGSMADYGHHLGRSQIIDLFTEALAQAPALNDDDANDGRTEEEAEFEASGLRGERERAAWVLSRLVEQGWIEQLFDEVNLQGSYRFTRNGRLFAQPLVDTQQQRFRTRNRNTRNTRNALRAFTERGEIHDLLDAWEFSERIISDFSDLVTELEDRKRQLVSAVEQQLLVQQASDQFFDYMDTRFEPDIAVRLSADSVEKYREEIARLIRGIRRKESAFKAEAEKQLRQSLPDYVEDRRQSLLIAVLEGIEQRVRGACEVMLPQVRQALQSYTQRADIIIRQMTYLASQQRADIQQVCEALQRQSADTCEQRLQRAAEQLAGVSLNFLDPVSVRLRERRSLRRVQTTLEAQPHQDADARREAFVKEALDKAFVVNSQDSRAYLAQQLASGQRICSDQLTIEDARQLLSRAHLIELASINDRSSEQRIRVRFLEEAPPSAAEQEFFTRADRFEIWCEETPPS